MAIAMPRRAATESLGRQRLAISELSKATGVPLATVKYSLREGLLPAGRATGATQAQYDESHVIRLRLARSLVQVGGLSVAAARDVLAALDTPGQSHVSPDAPALRQLPVLLALRRLAQEAVSAETLDHS